MQTVDNFLACTTSFKPMIIVRKREIYGRTTHEVVPNKGNDPRRVTQASLEKSAALDDVRRDKCGEGLLRQIWGSVRSQAACVSIKI